MSSRSIVQQAKKELDESGNKYSWKPGTRIGVLPDVAMREFRKIYDEKSAITPADVLDRATDLDSPLHYEFDWNDPTAAHAHRMDQARYMLRSLVVVVRKSDGNYTEPVRAVLSVYQATPDHGDSETPNMFTPHVFIPVNQVFSEADQRRQQLVMALKELAVFRKRYQNLEALARLFADIDEVEQGVLLEVEQRALILTLA